MKYYRYSKLRAHDYWLLWLPDAILFFLGCLTFFVNRVICAEMEISLIGAFLIFLALTFFFTTLVRLREHFCIEENTLTVTYCGRRKEIILPAQLTVVICYSDFIPPLATRAVNSLYMKQTLVFDGQFAAVLMEGALDQDSIRLFRRYHYSSSHVADALQERLIYSFACDQELFDRLTDSAKCSVVIPASLFKKLTINNFVVQRVIDHTV